MTAEQRMKARLKERLETLPIRIQARNGSRAEKCRKYRILSALHRGSLNHPEQAAHWLDRFSIPYRRVEMYKCILLITEERTLFYRPDGELDHYGRRERVIPEQWSLLGSS